MKRDLDAVVARPPAALSLATAPVLACAIAVVAILALHWRTAASIVAIWIRSETFAHGFVVVPICLWFAWRKRAELAATPASPWWPGLALVAGFGAAWLIATAADVQGPKQFALAFMLQAAIVTIVGLRVARVAAFPLAFLLFAVPFGDFLVPTLIDWTADFTVGALRLSGVPVYREANHFIIPSGWWSVVEACSGVRYIIASLMVGTMFAAIAYRSPRRRAWFVLASILVPVVANWLRAYMIVMLGHLSDNRLAVGIDHVIYGWVFFGVVMVVLFWVGSRWQEFPPDEAKGPPAAAAAPLPLAATAAGSRSAKLWVAAVAAIAAATLWLPVEAMMGRDRLAPRPLLPAVDAAAGWVASPRPVANWRPLYEGAAAEFRQAYRNGADEVGLQISYYRNQVKGAELVTSSNLLTPRESWVWKQIESGKEQVAWQGSDVTVDRAELRGATMSLEVWSLYRVHGRLTSNPYYAKALLAWSRLTGQGDDAALVVLYTPLRGSGEAARASLRSFAQAMAAPIDRALGAAESSGRASAGAPDRRP